MAFLALGLVGAGIGSAIGGTVMGMSMASIGFTIGSSLATLLFPTKLPDVDGPRISDARAMTSAYGSAIPRIYGTMRVGGQVIADSCIRDTPTTEEVGGKGGPTQDVTTHHYFVTMAVALASNQIVGLRKIWANGTLIYDVSGTSVEAIAAGANRVPHIKFYNGSEEQLPDPSLEAIFGAGEVEAYRGVAYVVLTDLPLIEPYFGYRPQLTFEVVQSGSNPIPSVISTPTALFDLQGRPGLFAGAYSNGVFSAVQLVAAGGGKFTLRRTLYDIDLARISSQDIQHTGTFYGSSFICCIQGTSDYFIYQRNSNAQQWGTFGSGFLDADPAETLSPIFPTFFPWDGIAYLAGITANQLVFVPDAGGLLGLIVPPIAAGIGAAPSGTLYQLMWSLTSPEWHAIRAIAAGSYVTGKMKAYYIPLSFYSPEPVIRYDGQYLYLIAGSSTAGVGGTHTILRIDPVTLQEINRWVFSGASMPAGEWFYYARDFSIYRGMLMYIYPAVGQKQVRQYQLNDDNTFTLIGYIQTLPVPGFTEISCHIMGEFGMLWFYGSTIIPSGQSMILAMTSLPTPTPAEVSSIISDLCVQAGLTAGQVDVTNIADTCDGYLVGQVMAARAAIEKLQAAYHFDARETGRRLHFRKRAASGYVATLDYADLAGHALGSTAPPRLTVADTPVEDLPANITLNFLDIGADYQVGTAVAKRIEAGTQQLMTIDVPIAMTGAQAAQVVDRLMAQAWTSGAKHYTFQTTRKWAHLEPCDPIIVNMPYGSRSMIITKKRESGLLVSFEAEGYAPEAYVSTAVGSAGDTPGNVLTLPGPTRLALLDIPTLREQDDGSGFYAVEGGYKPEWNGGGLFRSQDSGATWTDIGAFSAGAAMGNAATALGSYAPNIVDESNTVSIVLTSGSLFSTDHDGITAGANLCYLGGELLQFRTATLTAANTYLLSGLLRGRFGTEQYVGTHAIGEAFVLLTTSASRPTVGSARIAEPTARIGVASLYRAAARGTSILDADQVSFTNTGVSLKPLSPVGIGGGRTAPGDILCRWVRRNRTDMSWRDGVDAPLGETTEAYELEIWTAGYAALKRTVTGLSTPAYTYSAADQVTDFGGLQGTIYVRVYQLSSVVGRGFAGNGSI